MSYQLKKKSFLEAKKKKKNSYYHYICPSKSPLQHIKYSMALTNPQAQTGPQGEIVIGDVEYDGRVILYVIKG